MKAPTIDRLIRRASKLAPPIAVHMALGVAVLAMASCWPGWTEIFELTPSREHRVEDMRVLAVELAPASLVIPAAMLRDPDDTTVIDLEVTPRVFDPRGGDVDLAIGLCAATFAGARCAEGDVDPIVLTAKADTDEPLGQAPARATFHLTGRDIRALYESAEFGRDSLASVALQVVVNASRKITNEITEREQAVLSVEMRVDPFSVGVSFFDLAEARAGICGPALDDFCDGTPPPIDACGNGVLDVGEACEPPNTIDVCSPDCQSIAICPQAPLMCARPLVPNVPPVILGLARGANVSAGAAEIAPGDTVDVDAGGELAVTLVMQESTEPRQTVLGPQSFAFGEFEGGPGPQPGRDVEGEVIPGEGCSTPENGQFQCPTPPFTSVRWYIGDTEVEIASPVDELGNYLGNDGSTRSITLKFGAEPAKEPLVVVVVDSFGGMDTASFTFDAK